jgi:hypothetical protein
MSPEQTPSGHGRQRERVFAKTPRWQIPTRVRSCAALGSPQGRALDPEEHPAWFRVLAASGHRDFQTSGRTLAEIGTEQRCFVRAKKYFHRVLEEIAPPEPVMPRRSTATEIGSPCIPSFRCSFGTPATRFFGRAASLRQPSVRRRHTSHLVVGVPSLIGSGPR